MGIKVQYKSYLPGSHPMGDLNEDSNSGTWPVFHKPSSSGQFHNPYSQNNIANAYFGNHTEAVKQKILEHEAIFKNQLYELHRLYRVQMDLMDELKMKELHKQSMALETSISSCSASQRQDAPRWNASSSSAFPLLSSTSAKPGVLGAKDFNKIPSFLTGKSSQNGMVSSSNAVMSKDCEVEILECRPSKVRRKFDLELRADEYIDLEEPNYNPKRPPDVLRYTTNGSCNGKMFLGGSVKIDSRGDGARLKNGENGSAGLNKQIHSKGHNSSPFNIVGCDSNFRSNQQFCSIPALPLEFMHHGRDHNRSRNLTVTPTDNGNMWPHMLDSAQSKGQATAFSQNLISEKLNLFNKGQDAPYLGTDQIKADYWNERSEGSPKHSGNGVDFFNRVSNNHESSKSFSTLTPWEKSGSCMAQKSARAEMHPCFILAATLPQSLQSSCKSGWTPGQGWKNNFEGGKGSYSGSGLASFPPSGSGYLNCGPFMPNGSINLKGLNSIDAHSSKGIDLNIASTGDIHDSVDRPYRGHVADLPWLKSGVGLKNGEIQSLKSSVPSQVFGPGSSVYDIEAKPGANHIFGVPIFGDCQALKGAQSCRSPPEELEGNQRIRGFDMNWPCESVEKDAETHVLSKRNHIDLNMCLTDDNAVMTDPTNSEKTVKGFDLESPCETEENIVGLKRHGPEHLDKDLVTVAAAEAILSISSWRKLTLTETSARNPTPVVLRWFVDVISSNADDADKVVQEAVTEEAESIDYFEYMTMQLPETKEDDYLPEYPTPSELEEQTEAGPCTTRTRKGQARRCRAKRDFQRDILPGLTSLARHEVTEDLQTLGGLMRAMGHSWQSRLTRRAGPRRGRPRLTPLPPPAPASSPSPLTNNTVTVTTPTSSPSPQKKTTTTTISQELVNMEDHRSLTSWGKTTRRPRRQRCGNNASVLRIA